MRNLRLSLLAILAVLCWSKGAIAAYGSTDGNATYVYRASFYLQAGQAYMFETKNLSPGGDTVMHLWSTTDSAQVAWNDDFEGLASRIIYTPASGKTGTYLLVVRSYSTGSRGSCEIWFQSQFYATTTFAGWQLEGGKELRDTHETVLLDGGATDTFLYLLDGSGAQLLRMDDDSGVGLASKISLDTVPLAEKPKTIVSLYMPEANDLTRILVNDAGADQDGDGLGVAFERYVCTCDSKLNEPFYCPWTGTTLNCANIVGHAKDTDNDGLEDRWEIVGIDDASHPQPLIKWGAHALHKDVFVECDRKEGVPKMPSAVASQIATIYNKPGSASSLANWDGTSGVKVHVDIGVSGGGQTYGDWGGGGGVVGLLDSVENPTLDQLWAVRRGVFHYCHLMPGGSSGQGAQWGTTFYTTPTTRVPVSRTSLATTWTLATTDRRNPGWRTASPIIRAS